MNDIKHILNEIAGKKNIRILYACETGSRAWGFPSPDSDYDVRFIYMHERDWYLSLGQRKDTIEFMDGELDITGWDLKKCLTLLKKSNTPLIERFQSPIGYYAVEGFKNEFKELIESYYSPTAVFFHHYSLAKKFWGDIKDANEFKLKSWFYLVRSLLSCNWIMQDRSVLPMHMEGLMQYVSDDIRNKLRALIELKKGVGEKYLHQKDEMLNEWILGLFQLLELSGNSLGISKTDMSLLNKFFLKMLYAETDH
jgi:predicted nucleotidyltransferase